MGFLSTLFVAAALATTRTILQRNNMLSEGFSAFAIVIVGFVAYLFLREDDAPAGEVTDPTPPSDPSTTLSGPADVERWINEATRASNLTAVPRDLILAVIWQESGGDPTAVGSAGEQGLMQVTEVAAQDVGETNVSTEDSPQRQITVGAKYLAKCRKYVSGRGTFEQLRCYNEGPPPLTQPASKTYAQQVLAKQERLRNG